MNKKLNKNFLKVVSILNQGGYHDGTTIGEKLQMTRSAVWKTIKKLESHEIKIDSIKGKGYALLEPLILLDSNKIKKNISHHAIDLIIFESVNSTNEYLKKFKNNNGIKICLAEKQTEGKGRFNRQWVSPFGRNIYLSCLYPFQKDVSELSGLSMVVSLALIKMLKNFSANNTVHVKWPNDVVYDNQKLSGCLVEIQAENHGASQVVIGIGINVNMLDDEKNISQAWTSLQKINNSYLDRNILAANLIDYLLEYLHKFEMHGLSSFVSEWDAADCLTNKQIAVKNLNNNIQGKVLGINEQGHLKLKLKDGNIKTFSSGETSIVK